MSLIKNIIIAAWVFCVGVLYFLCLFVMGVGLLIKESLFSKKA